MHEDNGASEVVEELYARHRSLIPRATVRVVAKQKQLTADEAAEKIDLAKASDADLANIVSQLKPEEALFFLAKLEAVMNKRKLQLTGYLVALVVWLVGMFFALAYYGTHDGFVGWVFLMPFALVGVILFAFGKWS